MIAPPNFGFVEDGIYRCGAPDARSFGFLASLKLRTTILLTDHHDEAFVRFLQECGVNILCPTGLSPSSGSVLQRRQPSVVMTAPAYPMGVMDGEPSSMAYGASQQQLAAAQGVRASSDKWTVSESGTGVQNDGYNMSANGQEGGRAASSGAVPEGTAEGHEHSLSASVHNASIASPTPPLSPSLVEDQNSNLARFLRRGNTGFTGASGGFHAVGNVNNRNSGGGGVSNAPGGGGTSGVAGGRRGQGEYGFRSDEAGSHLGGASSPSGPFNFNTVMVGGRVGPMGGQSVNEGPRRPDGGSSGNGGGGGAGPSQGGGGLMTLSESVVVDILHILLDPCYYPVLITCSMGRYRTGIVCGCLRKLQRWNLVSILEEYRRFAGDKSRAENEDFIELFDKDLVCLELPGGRRSTILYH